MKTLILIFLVYTAFFLTNCGKDYSTNNNKPIMSSFDSNWVNTGCPSFDQFTRLFLTNKDHIFVEILISQSEQNSNYEQKFYRSTDNGDSWSEIKIDTNTSIQDIHDDKSGTLYALDWYNGLYKSNDDGNSWIKINNPQINLSGIKFFHESFVVAKNGDIIMGTGWNLNANSKTRRIFHRSSDGGNSWSVVKNGNDTLEQISFFKLAENGIIYAHQILYDDGIRDSYLWFSTDNGLSWSKSGNVIHDCRENFSSNAAGMIFCSYHLYSINSFLEPHDFYTYCSKDNGKTFTKINQPYNNYCKSIINDDKGALYISSHVIYKSTDNGDTWVNLLDEDVSIDVSGIITTKTGYLFFIDNNVDIYRSRKPYQY